VRLRLRFCVLGVAGGEAAGNTQKRILGGRRPPKNIVFLALVVGAADHERQKKRNFWRAKPSRPPSWELPSGILI